MRRRTVDLVAAPVYAAIDFAVIMAPSLALKAAADDGGMGGSTGIDLVLASLAVAAPHSVVAWARLRSEERMAVRRADLWLASVNALVALALGATLVLMGVLYGFTDEHASLADQGYPVVALWFGLLVAAVMMAELVGRFLFWWLEPHESRRLRQARRQGLPGVPGGVAIPPDAIGPLVGASPGDTDVVH